MEAVYKVLRGENGIWDDRVSNKNVIQRLGMAGLPMFQFLSSDIQGKNLIEIFFPYFTSRHQSPKGTVVCKRLRIKEVE